MKKLSVILLLAIGLISISSCTKEGPAGPTGPQGPQGNQGPTGQTAIELDFDIPSANWGQVGTSGTPGAYIYAYLISPYLSFDSIGSGTVNVFHANSDGSFTALPYINYNSSGTQFTNQFTWINGGLYIDIYNSLYTYSTPSNDFNYKVVVIPGTGKTSWPVDLNDYNAVASYFKIKKVH